MYHRKLTKLSEILPHDQYTVEWFSATEILFKIPDTNVSYDKFGREVTIVRDVKETRNGEDYGAIYVKMTGSKVLRKIN